MTPEEKARQEIDAKLTAAGWVVQDRSAVNFSAARGIAVREVSLERGHGEADYLLFADAKAIGSVEAKPEGFTLRGVEVQSDKYLTGLNAGLPAWRTPLPFAYESTGAETHFTNRLEPDARSRTVFAFHRPETLIEWVQQAQQLRERLRHLPPLLTQDLWSAQVRAIEGLEKSLAANRPRALIQMATGSGKTFTAVNSVYRLVKFARARRVLFLVDRANLGRQALKEFQQFVTPDDGRKFTELYNVQHLAANQLDPVARVTLCTIQRLYSMLRGEAELPEDLDEQSGFELADALDRQPVPVAYNPLIPIETFDVIIVDECHRSIYNLWRQVLEYFDAFVIGLTATPSKQTFGYFDQNLVMEYHHEQAVADGVNVNYDVYRIRTAISERGSKVAAGFYVDRRSRLTRKVRWEMLGDDLVYDAAQLDRDVVAPDQIRTVVRTFRDQFLSQAFPGRTHVPKTLIYAKDDSHADDIVEIVRQEFGKGNDFCQKITYRTTGVKTEDLIAAFRNSYAPRIAVTVDMIATGTDIKPLEVVVFLRAVRSRTFFEQMKGRGVRVMSETDFQAVTPDARNKTHFVLVDAVGVCEGDKTDSRPLERKRTIPFEKLLQAVALGNRQEAVVSSLAGRLARLERLLDRAEHDEVRKLAGGRALPQLTSALVEALDPDRAAEAAQAAAGPGQAAPTATQIEQTAAKLVDAAVAPLATNPALRGRLVELQRAKEQTIDTVSKDQLLVAEFDINARAAAESVVRSFRDYIEQHHAEITALQLLYNRPYRQRLTEDMLKELEAKLRSNHAAWTEDRLWEAFAATTPAVVKGRSQAGRFADLVALVRFALQQQPVLEPFSDSVNARFDSWLRQKATAGVTFNSDQLAWLNLIRDHVATTCSIEPGDFDYAPFSQQGGLGRAAQLFGERLEPLLEELNAVLVA